MDKKNRIAVVFTAEIVGGHELMAISHIKKFLKKGYHIDCFVPSNNFKLLDIMNESKLHYIKHNVLHKKLELMHTYVNFSFKKKASNFLRGINKKFNYIIIVQGDIELGSVFINAAKKSKLTNIVSYIPYTHSFKLMGSKFGYIKDFLAKYIYKNCDKYITISKTFEKQLKNKNKNAEVRILKNFVPSPGNVYIRDDGFYKKKLEFVILMAGRVFFRQKGQDLLLEALDRLEVNKKIIVKVIGDGPDLENLKSRSKTIKRNINCEFYGWQNNIWKFSKDVDLIVMPSLYEGVPLIMLEALKVNIPIIAPARDGMVDYLPKCNLYRIGDRENEIIALSEKINHMIINLDNGLM